MNATITNLKKREQRVVRMRNKIKWGSDKENGLMDQQLNKADMLLRKIESLLKLEYNKLYK